MSLRAAIYARKSNLDKKSKADAQTQSVLRQIDLAKVFIASKGWTLAEVYQDDGISGTIVRRAGLDALLEAAQAPRRPFDAVVMMDLDRLAREQVFAPRTLDSLANDAGVEIWEYSTGQRLEYTTEEQKLMVNIRLFGDGHYVQSITRKTAESLDGKRARGSVVGVAPLGYTTRRGDHRRPRRRPVRHRPRPGQGRDPHLRADREQGLQQGRQHVEQRRCHQPGQR